MNILEVLTAGQGGQVVGNLAQSFGIDRKQAADVLTAVVPELAYNMERQSFNRGGLADLVSALGQADYSKALAPGAPLTSPGVKEAGIEALDTLLWSKDRSRTVAHRAARASGVDESLVRQMLPSIAAIVMGGIASKAGGTLSTIASEVGAAPSCEGRRHRSWRSAPPARSRGPSWSRPQQQPLWRSPRHHPPRRYPHSWRRSEPRPHRIRQGRWHRTPAGRRQPR